MSTLKGILIGVMVSRIIGTLKGILIRVMMKDVPHVLLRFRVRGLGFRGFGLGFWGLGV